MAHTGKLSAIEVTKAKGPAVLHDGGGLYLRVSQTGSKSWVYRFQIDGKRRDMGLGPFPDISLAEARGKATAHRKQRHDGHRSARRQGRSAAGAAAFCRQGADVPRSGGGIHRSEPGGLAQREAPAAMAQHARNLRLPIVWGIAR